VATFHFIPSGVTNGSGGNAYAENDVAVLFCMGQSNASGVNGTTPVGLSNVYCMSADTREWVPWNNDFNVAAASTGKSTPGCEFAQLWQNQIDAGADLPDLYVLHCAVSGQGISTFVGAAASNRWNPVPPYYSSTGTGPSTNTWKVPGDGPLAGQSLYLISLEAVQAGITDLLDAGLNPRLLGMVWAQGERDCATEESADEYERLFTLVYQGLAGVTDTAGLPLFPIDLRIPNTTTYPFQAQIRDTFEKRVQDDRWSLEIDPENSALWDATAPNRGVYGSDGLHYNLAYLQEVAQTVYDQTIGQGFLGYPLVGGGVGVTYPALTPISGGVLHSKAVGVPQPGVNTIPHGLDPEQVLEFEDHLEVWVKANGSDVRNAEYVGLTPDGTAVQIDFDQASADTAQVYFKIVWSGAW